MVLSIKNIVFGILSVVAVYFFLLAVHAQAGEKIQVCHFTNSESNPIIGLSISVNALQKHLDHGDTLYDTINGCSNGGGDPTPS